MEKKCPLHIAGNACIPLKQGNYPIIGFGFQRAPGNEARSMQATIKSEEEKVTCFTRVA